MTPRPIEQTRHGRRQEVVKSKLGRRKSRMLVLNHGMGLNSMAVMVGFIRKGIVPDEVVFADVGGEKRETYRYIKVLRQLLSKHGWPKLIITRYKPKRFLRYPPYSNLEENCLSNGTVPGIAVGKKNCSLKWKAAPIHSYIKSREKAQKVWGRGDPAWSRRSR